MKSFEHYLQKRDKPILIPNAYTEMIVTPKGSRSVEAYWSFDPTHAGQSIVLPDGRCDIILRWDSETQQMPVPIITGPATSAYQVAHRAGERWLGVRLRPQNGVLIWGSQICNAMNKVIRGDEARALFPALSCVAQCTIDGLMQALAAHSAVQPTQTSSKQLERAIDLLHLTGGRVAIDRLAGMSGFSPRQLHRAFKAAVGLSPKTYAQLIKFHRTLGLIQTDQLSLADVTFEGGYADQSHMTRTCQRFGGFAPSNMPAGLSLPAIFA